MALRGSKECMPSVIASVDKVGVIPATPSGPLALRARHGQAGIQSEVNWIPACMGMTMCKVSR